MATLFKKPLAYLSTSFVLFLIAPPLVSIGTTSGPRALLWLGLTALCIGALIPPVQRLVLAPESSSASKPDNESGNSSRKEGS